MYSAPRLYLFIQSDSNIVRIYFLNITPEYSLLNLSLHVFVLYMSEVYKIQITKVFICFIFFVCVFCIYVFCMFCLLSGLKSSFSQ